MNTTRLNAYRVMWLFVLFDLPVKTKAEKSKAARFRKNLLEAGFTMLQYSVYTRHCASRESLEAQVQRVRNFMPADGHVSLLQVTDKQYSRIINVWGKRTKEMPKPPPQMEMF
jgi:CRISPR-associated protein Cas2